MAHTERAGMENALRAHCVPLLRKAGFKGSFPDLYRDVEGFVSLINFQFFSAGGSFCINISFADRNRDNVYYQKASAARQLRVSHCTHRARLGAPDLAGDKWFSFGKTSYGELRGEPQTFPALVEEINQLVQTVAMPWWLAKSGSGGGTPTTEG